LDNTSKPNEKNQETKNTENKKNEKLESIDKEQKENIKTESKESDIKKNKNDVKPKPIEKKIQPKTSEPKKQLTKDKDAKVKDDFKYIVRIANTDIDGEKTLVRGLTSIKGIGMHMSTLVIDSSGLDRKIKIGNLTDKQIEKIQDSLENILKTAPSWMLNHQKDIETGKDVHFIGSEIEMRLRDEINIMKKIRSYKGIRHERGLTVRGQRTRANNRKGLSLGVSKKGVQKKQ
jgi:small subunit ribosomal protein S13